MASSPVSAVIAVVLLLVGHCAEVPASLAFANNDGEEIEQPHHTSTDTVPNDRCLTWREQRVVHGEHQAKPPVDDP